MSYGFDLLFVKQPFEIEGEALQYGANLVKTIVKNRTLAKEQIKAHPGTIYNRLMQAGVSWDNQEQMKDVISSAPVRMAIESAANAIFSQRLIYWPQYKLLAVVGDCVPNELKAGMKAVHFQNSCDQDYEYSEWPEEIPFFKNEIDAILAASKKELFGWSANYDEDTDLEYIRRSLLYTRIFEKLSLDNWLYRADKEDGFSCFSVNGIFSQDLLQEMAIRIKRHILTNENFHCI